MMMLVTENAEPEDVSANERPRLATNQPEIPAPTRQPFISQFNDPIPFS
jgi:hypothetical protein